MQQRGIWRRYAAFACNIEESMVPLRGLRLQHRGERCRYAASVSSRGGESTVYRTKKCMALCLGGNSGKTKQGQIMDD
eukprot:6152993-Pleurochrysis_carterae.AAC.1